jgi:hypothetical protein
MLAVDGNSSHYVTKCQISCTQTATTHCCNALATAAAVAQPHSFGVVRRPLYVPPSWVCDRMVPRNGLRHAPMSCGNPRKGFHAPSESAVIEAEPRSGRASSSTDLLKPTPGSTMTSQSRRPPGPRTIASTFAQLLSDTVDETKP